MYRWSIRLHLRSADQPRKDICRTKMTRAWVYSRRGGAGRSRLRSWQAISLFVSTGHTLNARSLVLGSPNIMWLETGHDQVQ